MAKRTGGMSQEQNRNSRSGGRAWPWIILTLIVLPIAVSVGMLLAWTYLPQARQILLVGIALFGLAGVYPLTYIAYLGFRAQAQRRRLRDDFELFGLASENDVDRTVNELYQKVYSWPQFVVYILLIVTVTVLVVIGYLNRSELSFAGAATVELVACGYLGAYVFSIQELVRRYNAFDLQPQVYSSILTRMLTAMAIVFAISLVVPAGPGLSAGDVAAAEAGRSAWLVILAFAIGGFPGVGIRWLVHRANWLLNPPIHPENELSLRNLLGISAWHEARLSTLGVHDAQNLAAVDIPRLLLTTQFDTHQVANWIDQAILYVKVGARIDLFRDAKIATFHELQGVLGDMHSADPADQAGATSSLAAVLGLTDPDEFRRLRLYSNYPNYDYLMHYYERMAAVSSQRAEAPAQRLAGTGIADEVWGTRLSRQDQDDLESERDRLLRQLNGGSRSSALDCRLGEVHLLLRQDGAEGYYTRAIELDDRLTEAYYGRSRVYRNRGQYQDAIKDATKATDIDPAYAEAFNHRGAIYIQMKRYRQAIQDLDRALELDPRLAAAHYNRGVACNAQGSFAEAAAEFERAYLAGYEQAALWFSWGLALIALDRYEEAVEKLTGAITRGLDVADAYANRGHAYFELGPEYDDQAQMDYQTALDKDAGRFEVHNGLGNLKFLQGDLESAVKYYDQALTANERYFPARYNLAIVHLQLGRLEDARTEFRRLSRHPQDLDDYEPEQVEDLADWLGLSSSTLNELQAALELNRALEDKEGEALSYWQLGTCYQQRGELQESKECLGKAYSLYRSLSNADEAQVVESELDKVQDLLNHRVRPA